MDKIGFIGLGIMGRPMAKRLLNAGKSLCVNDIDGSAVRELEALGAVFRTPAQIGEECTVVLTILPTGNIVKSVLFSENGVACTLKKGSVVVDMSSVTPVESRDIASKLAEIGVDFLDAPVSGGEPKAIDGTLSFMVGGEPPVFERLCPLFDIMGASSLLVGGSGSGSTAKLANQIIVNLTIAAISEAFMLAAKAGTDPAKVYEAIRGGLAGSTVLDAKAPMMLRRDFKPGGKISINYKDIRNVMATALELDLPLPLTAQLQEIMKTLKVYGHLDDDHSGILQYFEMLADITAEEASDGR